MVKSRPRYAGARRLLVADVLERGGVGPVVDGPDLTGAELLAVRVEDAHAGAADGAPDRARLLEPAMRLGDGRGALHPAVGLPDHRAPPLHHPALHVERARCRRVHDRVQARHVVAGAHLLGEAQQPVELRRHHVRGEHAVLLDQAQRLLGIETGHDHEGMADVERAHVIGVATAVVHRGRHQVRPAEGHEIERPAEHRGVVGDLPGIARGLRTPNPLGPAGGARRVDEQRARRTVVGDGRGLPGPGLGERLEPVDHPDRERGRQPSAIQRRNLPRELLVGDQRARARMLEDGGQLVFGEERVERDEVPTRLVAGERAHDQVDAVGQQGGDGVARLHPARPEQVDELVRATGELAVGERTVGRRDHRGKVGMVFGDPPEAEALVPHRGHQRNRGVIFGATPGFSSGEGFPTCV